MSWQNKAEGYAQIDLLGAAKRPFLFIISYDQEQILAQPLESLDEDILYDIEGLHKHPNPQAKTPSPLYKHPLPYHRYKASFDKIIQEIQKGNTYLLNLTFATPIQTDDSLKHIFDNANAKYKLCYKDSFVCFSPECFVEIDDGILSTYPMKGTIDASIPHAKEIILADTKEMAEHTMIVDLMRNDLSIIAQNVKVEKFRYVEEIAAGDTSLLQVSSKITATLSTDWQSKIGTLLCQILPAGSITGAPKKRTMEIIQEVEDFDRGFYTGVFGIYDGKTLRSAVMIRFIEKHEEKLIYKSGGGITLDSIDTKEYKELIDKIYLPF